MKFECGKCNNVFEVTGIKESVVTCSKCGSKNSIRESEDIDNIPVNSEDTKLLIKAIRETDMSTVEQLIDSGTDLMQETPTGDSPLSVAIEKNNFEAVKLIIAKNRATVNKIGSDTRSPLLIALGWNRLKIARLLLDNGANIKYKNKAGYDALRIAKDKGKLGTPGDARMLKLITDYSSNEAVDYITRGDTVTRVVEAISPDVRSLIDTVRLRKDYVLSQIAKQGVDITTGSGRRIPCSSRGSGIFKDKVEGVVAIISLNMAGQFSRITFFPKDLDKDCSFSINDTPGYKYNAYFFELE